MYISILLFATNPDIVIGSVCDPALWTEETYGIQKNNDSRTIGLGVIRPEIYRDYVGYVSTQYLFDMYFAICQRLLDEGYNVEFFSNGLSKDNRFINQLFNTYPSLKENEKVGIAFPETTNELVETIANYHSFLAVRLHASIIGSVLGIGNINLTWNKKQPLFGKQIGTEGNYLTTEQFDDVLIAEKLLTVEAPKISDEYKMSVLESLKSILNDKRW